MELAVVGIDGLDPGLIHSWRDELPTLSGLISEGGFGDLQSTYPPLTCPAWPTLVTGKQGGKHGVYGFTKPAEDTPTKRTPVNYDDLAAESIWEVVDGERLSIGVVNVPFTYPPSDLENGFVISGWPIPNKVNPANPPEILDRLEDDLGRPYEVNPFPMGPEYDSLSPEETREEIVNGMWHHHEAFTKLVGQHDLDVFFGVYMAMDHAGHQLAWHRDELKAAYREQDEALAEFLEELPEETNVVVVSDHGHGGQSKYSFWPNNWLAENGFQERGASSNRRRRDLFRTVGITRENAIKIKNLVGIDDPRDILPQRAFQALKWLIPAGEEEHTGFDPSGIDWTASEAFAPIENIIYLNDGRFEGAVDERCREDVRAEVADALESIEHPDENRDDSLMTAVKTKHELFDGPFVESAPDIVFVPDGMEVNTPIALGDTVFTSEQFGEHRPMATLITAGPVFADSDPDCPDADIKDVFPLICGVLDIPVPENVDGDIPGERFEESVELESRSSRDSYGRSDYTTEEATQVEEQLKGLGYLE
jgi:predicted AlkP superfamily phosphohydrolase/phosphomutase